MVDNASLKEELDQAKKSTQLLNQQLIDIKVNKNSYF